MQPTVVQAFLAAMWALLIAANAFARDSGQWEGQDPRIKEWFEHLKQPDHPRVSCCGDADAYEADNFEVEGDHYIAIITDGKGVIRNGTRIPVPNGKMKWDAGNPTGHGIIFLRPEMVRLNEWTVYCYVAPGGVRPLPRCLADSLRRQRPRGGSRRAAPAVRRKLSPTRKEAP